MSDNRQIQDASKVGGVEVGQVWEDEDGKRWKVHAFSHDGQDEWVYVRRNGHPTSALIQTNPGWFAHWTLV